MLSNKNNSKTFIEKFVCNNQKSTIANVSSESNASSSELDAKAKEVLNYIHSMPPAYQFEPNLIRQFRQNPYEHEEVLDLTKQDISIPCEDHNIAARVYRSNNSQCIRCPALIYFHGGGFVLGDIDSYDKMLSQLCSQSGVVIISVAYRLAPETVFPGAVEDTQYATDWIFNNTKRLNLDPNRIAIGGDSAGANLATGYCLQNKKGFKPNFQILIYPSIIGNETSKSRETFSENLLLTKELLRWFHNHYISKGQENDPRFNIMKFDDFSFLPPAFILTCGFDPLRDEGQMFVEHLNLYGVPVKHSCYRDMFHGFINYGKLQQAQDAVTECAMILKGVMNIK